MVSSEWLSRNHVIVLRTQRTFSLRFEYRSQDERLPPFSSPQSSSTMVQLLFRGKQAVARMQHSGIRALPFANLSAHHRADPPSFIARSRHPIRPQSRVRHVRSWRCARAGPFLALRMSGLVPGVHGNGRDWSPLASPRGGRDGFAKWRFGSNRPGAWAGRRARPPTFGEGRETPGETARTSLPQIG
jgi:hypothetical protein